MMKSFSLSILLVTFIGGNYAFEELSRFYKNPLWEQSLAFDAPIIEPEKTWDLLVKFLTIFPDNNLEQYFRKSDATWIKFAQQDIKKLIDIGRADKPEPCDSAHYQTYNESSRTTLTSIGGGKGYGKNIQVYVKHSQLETAKQCAKKTFNSNLLGNLAKELISLGGSMNESAFKAIESRDKLANGVVNLLKKVVDGYEEKAKHSKSRKEIHDKFELLKEDCKKLLDDSTVLRGFFASASGDSELEKFTQDHDLVERGVQLVACERIQKKTISDSDVNANLGLGSRIRANF